jgi:hypothetical protein
MQYKKIILFLIIILNLNTILFAQSLEDKYEHYRERLQYFVVPGLEEGQSLVAAGRLISITKDKEHLTFSDQATHLGYYMGVLSTEIYIKEREKEDFSSSLLELYYAMEAYRRLDESESKLQWSGKDFSDTLDGLFLRMDVPEDFISSYNKKLNKGLKDKVNIINTDAEKYTIGSMNWVSSNRRALDEHMDIMSQDQAIGVLMGFAIVKKAMPDKAFHITDEHGKSVCDSYNFHRKAIKYASLIIEYIAKDKWIIKTPAGKDVPARRGGDTRSFSKGFRKVYTYFNDKELETDNRLNIFLHGFGDDNIKMSCVLMAIGDFKNERKLYKKAKKYNWQGFYLMLWEFLDDKNSRFDYTEQIKSQLNAAPETGPFFYGVDKNNENIRYTPDYYFPNAKGWAASIKWEKDVHKQKYGDNMLLSIGSFNGLDYMLAHNLYLIRTQYQ